MQDVVQKDPIVEANEVLKKYWTEKTLPIDPFSIAYKMGLTVLSAELPDNISGALVLKDRNPRIFVNHKDSLERKRFTCAHEIGHFIDHGFDKTNDVNFEHTDYRGLSAQTGMEYREVFANRFAANLLMPEDLFALYHQRQNGDLYSISLIFGVSLDAAFNRKLNLKKKRVV